MIHIDSLQQSDIGRFVEYIDPYKRAIGKIKSWNHRFIFVVFHCDDNWNLFTEYTASACRPEDLEFRTELHKTHSPFTRRSECGGSLDEGCYNCGKIIATLDYDQMTPTIDGLKPCENNIMLGAYI
ncbi:MAG: hypothetical protein PVI90_13130, partial [Desulfobacteraceae bacterium]